MSKLSIIIPVYYNADTLMDCYEDLAKNLLPKLEDYELILVDDGSEDDSWKVCNEIVAKDQHTRLIKLSRNFGSHAASYAGLVACIGDCATVKSADCQEPPALILDMYESWKNGNRVVLAVREDREDKFSQKIFANLYYVLVRKYISKKMPKTGFDCFLLDRKAIEALKLLDERNSAITLQILWMGFTTSTVSYTRLARKKGKSHWSLSKKIKLFLDSFVTFSFAPIRFVEWAGVFVAAFSFIWAILIILQRLFGNIPVEGWTAMMVVILFSSGMTMFSLGILGEYVWRTLDVAQNRPVYFVEEEKDSNASEETN
jgi:dolichol-phosphate mannosyltransferase